MKHKTHICYTCITHPNISDELDNWHCRPIQNGRRRPFCQKKRKKKELRIDLKWPEMWSKVIFRHPKWPLEKKILYRSEMARIAIESEFRKSKMADWSEMAGNAIEREFRTSKMAAGSHFVKNFKKKKKLHIDLKWPEMRSKVNFGHAKWPTSAILSKISKKLKLRIDLTWPEMRSKVKFGHPKWPTSAILSKNLKKNKVVYRSEMARNEIESDFRTSKMAAGSHFVKKLHKIKIVVLIWNGKKCDAKWFLDIQNGYRRPFFLKHVQLDINSLLVNIYIYIQTAMLGTREYTLCSPFRANAHNSSLNCYLYYYTCTHNWLRNKHLYIHQYSLTPCSSETRSFCLVLLLDEVRSSSLGKMSYCIVTCIWAGINGPPPSIMFVDIQHSQLWHSGRLRFTF